MDEPTLEFVLENCFLKSIEYVPCGDGWNGNRYIFHSFGYGSSHPFKSFSEMKAWLIKKFDWKIREAMRNLK